MKYPMEVPACILFMSLLVVMSAAPCEAVELLHYTFDQVEGTEPFTTPDSSGRGNTGTLTSMDNTNLVPGRVGNALRFDGGTSTSTRDRVEVPTADVATLTDVNRSYAQFTFAAFVKPIGIAEEEPDTTFIAGKLGNSPQRGWQIGWVGTDAPTLTHPDEIVVSLFEGPLGTDNDNEFYSGPTTAVVNDQWVHLAFTFSSITEASSFFRMYINGEKVVDATTDLTQMNGVNTRAFQVGNRGDSRADSWSGLIDEVYLFDHALTDAEIAALIPPLPPPLAGDFDDDSDVDGADFLIWQQTLGAIVTPGGGADGNSNGMIDSGDLSVWTADFGGSGSSTVNALAGSAPVPEPSALPLLAAGCVGFRRNRQFNCVAT